MGVHISLVIPGQSCNQAVCPLLGATEHRLGQGVQPQPSVPHPAHWVGKLPGEPQAIFRPSEKRGAHALVEQWGRSPAPDLEKVGQPV